MCVYSEEFLSHWSAFPPPLLFISDYKTYMTQFDPSTPLILQHACSVSSAIIHRFGVPSDDLEHSLEVWGRVSEWTNGRMNSYTEFLASQWNIIHPSPLSSSRLLRFVPNLSQPTSLPCSLSFPFLWYIHFRILDAFETDSQLKVGKVRLLASPFLSISLCPAVHTQQLENRWADFHKVLHWGIFLRSVERFQFML